RLGESAAMGAGSGAVMATGLTVAGKALGAGYDGIKAKLEKKPGATDHGREPQAPLDSKHDEPGNRPGDSHTDPPADSCRQVPLPPPEGWQDPYTEKPNLRKVPDSVRPSERALEQSNHFARNHEISEKLRDGYHEGPGTYAEFGTDGRVLSPSVDDPLPLVSGLGLLSQCEKMPLCWAPPWQTRTPVLPPCHREKKRKASHGMQVSFSSPPTCPNWTSITGKISSTAATKGNAFTL